jgi:hypothetical protein
MDNDDDDDDRGTVTARNAKSQQTGICGLVSVRGSPLLRPLNNAPAWRVMGNFRTYWTLHNG